MDLAERALLEPRMKSLVALTALVTLDRIEEFEEQVLRDLDGGLAASDVLEALLELADLGIRVSPRAYELVRAHIV
jgi:hypothetical protein